MNREEKVLPFLEMAGVPVGEYPENVKKEYRELALALIFEEACVELAEASGVEYKLYELCKKYVDNYKIAVTPVHVDKIKQLDALADAQYVLSWAINVLGHSEHFEDAYNEVCMSNNSKACETEEIAQATADSVKDATVVYEKQNGTFIVKRASDGKLIKSINYIPANFKQFFE